MKYITSPSFDSALAKLPAEHRKLVYAKLPDFVKAAERQAGTPGSAWPAALRVRSMKGYPGLLEVTWNFSGPDLRATFQWTEIDGEAGIAWVDVGDHSIFDNPAA